MKRILSLALALLLASGFALAEGWSYGQPDGAEDAGITWEFITPVSEETPGSPEIQPEGDAPDDEAAATGWSLVPEGDAVGEGDAVAEGEGAPEGLEYPVLAEVVNCKKAVSLRSEPSTKASLLAEVPLGALVYVYSNQAWMGNDRWFVDASYEGQRGYICVEYLDVMLPSSLRYQRDYLEGAAGTVSAVNSGTDLILRSGPGVRYDSLGLLFGGEVLAYTGEAKQDDSGTCWYRCSHYGEDCWISAKYTELTLNDGRTYTGGKGIF